MVQPDKPQMAIKYGASTLRKATDKHSEYVILIAFPLQLCLRARASMLHLQVHCLSCSILLRFMFVLYSNNTADAVVDSPINAILQAMDSATTWGSVTKC
jgi:hypothetical protein